MSGGGGRPSSVGTPDGNLVVHGDNLHALKALLPTHGGRVKCIYIDPPYNTGNENWVYSDRLNSQSLAHWFDANNPVDGEDLERHDKWLCMMWPRLQLLRELLADDGVIFVSIDDNEQHHLRAIMDEVFGPDNFILCFIWNKKNVVQNDARFSSVNHEYVLAYRKSEELARFNLLPRTSEADQRYGNPDDDPRGPWQSVALHAKSGNPESRYSITFSNNVRWEPPSGTHPKFTRERLVELYEDNQLWFGSSGSNVPRLKKFLKQVKSGMVSNSLLLVSDVGSTQVSTQTLNSIMDGNVFSSPKSVKLIDRLLKLTTKGGDIVLDSFAGSGTTAHAVLALNKEDGGNRKFILVECEDYADSITAERVRRVIRGVPDAKDAALREGLGGDFTYCTLGDPITVEGMLSGESMPAFDQLAAYLINCATGTPVVLSDLPTPGDSEFDDETSFVFESDRQRFHLFYRPDAGWLSSNNGALNSERAGQIANDAKCAGKSAVVFGPVRYMNSADLRALGITFCQLPYELSAARARLS